MIGETAILAAGIYLLTVAFKGKHVQLIELLAQEKGFFKWSIALLLVYGIGVYMDRRIGNALFFLVVLGLVYSNTAYIKRLSDFTKSVFGE